MGNFNSLFCRSCLVGGWPDRPIVNLAGWRNGLVITCARATALSWLGYGRGGCDEARKMCANMGIRCVSWLGCLFATWFLWCGSLSLELKSHVGTTTRWLKLLTTCQGERQNPSGSITNLFMPHFTCLYNKCNDHHIVKGSFVPVVILAWFNGFKTPWVILMETRMKMQCSNWVMQSLCIWRVLKEKSLQESLLPSLISQENCRITVTYLSQYIYSK